MTRRLVLQVVIPFMLGAFFSGCIAERWVVALAPTASPTIAPTLDSNAVWATFQANPCSPPPGIAVDGEASARVKTWNDLNANGQIDTGEPVFPWVNYYVENNSYLTLLTDIYGTGRDAYFMPGCTCDCWKGKSVSVRVPLGYRATTATTQPLIANDPEYDFGFIQTNSTLAEFPGEPDWYQAFINMGFEVTSFHFDSDAAHFDMTLKVSSVDNWEDFYQRLFGTAIAIAYQGKVKFNDFKITLTPLDIMIACPLKTIHADWPTDKAELIARSYCIKK
jgi:hypothetical protein